MSRSDVFVVIASARCRRWRRRSRRCKFRGKGKRSAARVCECMYCVPAPRSHLLTRPEPHLPSLPTNQPITRAQRTPESAELTISASVLLFLVKRLLVQSEQSNCAGYARAMQGSWILEMFSETDCALVTAGLCAIRGVAFPCCGSRAVAMARAGEACQAISRRRHLLLKMSLHLVLSRGNGSTK